MTPQAHAAVATSVRSPGRTQTAQQRRVSLTRDTCSATVRDHPVHGLIIEVRRGGTVTDRWHVTPLIDPLLEEHARRVAAKDWAALID